MPEIARVEKKVQRTGGGTPYVYLPKEWANALFAEDRVTIRKLPLGLFITAPIPSTPEAQYALTDNGTVAVTSAVLSAYTQGYRVARIKYPDLTPKDRAEVSRFASRLIGVVAEIGGDRAILKEYAEQDRVDLAVLVEALFGKCGEIAASAKELLESGGDPDLRPQEMVGLLGKFEDDVDFLSFGLFRLLSSRSRYVENPGEQMVNLLFYSIVNYAAERYCDSLQGMAEAYALLLEKGDPGISALRGLVELSQVPESSLKLLDEAREVVLARDGKRASVIRQKIRSLRLSSWETSFARVLRRIDSSIRDAAILYPATRIGNRLLESGTYLESFCSRTAQFFFADPVSILR